MLIRLVYSVTVPNFTFLACLEAAEKFMGVGWLDGGVGWDPCDYYV